MRTLLVAAALSLPLLAGCSYHDHDDHHGGYDRDALYCDDVGYARYEYRDYGRHHYRDRHHDGHYRHRDRHHRHYSHH